MIANDPELVASHGLSETEYDLITGILGRAPNRVELGIFSVMWSEHCSYKSSRKHLSKFPTKAPWVVQGPGENAGVVDIGEGKVAVFKMESHNHPSFIEPYQGAATGVGGIMRDIFTMGARPVANLDALRFGEPTHPRTRHLLAGVVAGIGGYGNCVGVPTVGGTTGFHSSYNGNILVNAMCVGIADADKVFYARAGGIGNPVVYVGAKTGRDGIHGATMASAEFSDEGEVPRPTVQVGDPFTEKLLIEACLELMAEDVIVAIQDMGAAGLTSSSFEMASRGECGIELDLTSVPQRESRMTAYELMLSESQERMLMVLRRGEEARAEAIMRKWGLEFATIGHVTDTGRMVVRFHGRMVADVPVAPVAGAAPMLERPAENTPRRMPVTIDDRMELGTVGQSLLRLMASPELCSKRWITEQYDQGVMGDTVVGPGFDKRAADAAVVRIHGSHRGLALTADCTPRYCEVDPVMGGKQAVAEAWRNLIATGAKPLAITNCLNFGNPERPRIMGQFVGCIEGMAAACAALDFPVVSGNVSLYNETDGQAIQPTPTVGGVGLIDDLDHMAGLAFAEHHDRLVLIGETTDLIGATLFWRVIVGREEGAPPGVALGQERRIGELVLGLIRDRVITSCHDLGDGGLAVAVAEMCLASGRGAKLVTPKAAFSRNAWYFAEDQARYVIACDEAGGKAILERCRAGGVLAREIGRIGGAALTLGDDAPISLSEVRDAHERWLPDYMSG